MSTLLEQRSKYQSRLLEVTLALIVRDQQLLLAVKQKKIGAGLWNGPGGKIESGETPAQGMIREAQEELSITPTRFSASGIVEFYFPTQPEWNMKCHVFVVTRLGGSA